MAAQRPRLSVLALFDPLSSYSDSDKENDSGDSSFFHPHGLSKRVYCSPVQRLRRRLIDVGDVTVEEPDIRDLIQEELEAEINQSVALEEDENATLTFRDMAKAATPKWSGKYAVNKGTPQPSSTPRTPLTEIVTRDDTTPIGRKKTFKRPTATSAPEFSPSIVVHTAENAPTVVIRDFDNTSGSPSFSTFVQHTKVSGADKETTTKSFSPNAMGISTATLELPTSSGPLISDTPNPLFLSTSSLEPNQASRGPSSLRLRPNSHLSQSTSRHSVDLHSSFQLHLSSSETTFDLLNDKISFLGSKNGRESFLDHEDVSFGDGDSGAMNEVSSEMVPDEQRMETELDIKLDVFEEHVDKPALHDVIDRHASFPRRSGIPSSPAGKKRWDTLQTVKRIPDSSASEAESSVLSTPSPSDSVLRPPRPVPALRIVKRNKALEQAKPIERNSSDPRGTSRGKTNSISALNSRALKRTSFEGGSSILTSNDIKNGGLAKTISRIASSVSRGDQSADGPRRVLVREVPKRQDVKAQSTTVQAKTLIGVNGLRRVPASLEVGSTRGKADLATTVKYGVGPASGSGIPKAVSARNSGSKIPAAPSGKQRFGVQNEGYLGRRVAAGK